MPGINLLPKSSITCLGIFLLGNTSVYWSILKAHAHIHTEFNLTDFSLKDKTVAGEPQRGSIVSTRGSLMAARILVSAVNEHCQEAVESVESSRSSSSIESTNDDKSSNKYTNGA